LSNILENTIAFFSPTLAAKRERSRTVLESYRKFDGASKGRRTSDWNTTGSSANAEITKEFQTLVDRSRDLDRNNAYARKAYNVITTNTVGTGIMLSINGKEKDRENVIEVFNNWANSVQCDYDEHFNFYGLQKLVMRTVAMSGNCLVIRHKTKYKKGKTPLQIQVLEADFLDKDKDLAVTKSEGRIVNGVEFYKNGKRKGYWIYDRHPGDADLKGTTSTFYAAKDVLHIYLKDRPGQDFGVPFSTTSLITLKDFKDYQDAELLKQKIASAYVLFVTKNDPNQEHLEESSEGEITERVEPGTIQHLSPGESVTFAQPPTTSGYDPHTKRKLQEIAAGFGVTYEALSGDLTNVNFSSGRLGWLEFQRQITDWQYNLIIPLFCDAVAEWVFEASEIAGLIKQVPKREWTAPRREMIDPVKELNGMKLAVRNGFTSHSEALRELGYDPDNLFAEIAKDFERLKKLGLVLDSDPRNDVQKPDEQFGKGGAKS